MVDEDLLRKQEQTNYLLEEWLTVLPDILATEMPREFSLPPPSPTFLTFSRVVEEEKIDVDYIPSAYWSDIPSEEDFDLSALI